MLRDTAVEIIARRLGNRTDLDEAILDEMKLAQTQMEKFWPSDTMPWFLRTDTTSLVTVDGTATISLPTGFLREADDGGLFVYDGDEETWSRLCKHPLSMLWEAATEEGIPTKYALGVTNITLWPTPDAVYSMKMEYFGAATELEDNVENAWLANAPELLISATGLRMAAYVQDDRVGQLFMTQYGEGIKHVVTASLARELDNQVLYMGGS